MVGTGWDHHSRVRVATVHTFVEHNVLGVVLAEENKRVSLNSGWGLQFRLSASDSLQDSSLSEPRTCNDAHGGSKPLHLEVPVLAYCAASLSDP